LAGTRGRSPSDWEVQAREDGPVLPMSPREDVCVGAGRRGVLCKELLDSQIYGGIHT